MKKLYFLFIFAFFFLAAFKSAQVTMALRRESTIDSLGACQGISYQKGRVFLYGDREVGMIREFKLDHDSLVYLHKEYQLTLKGQDVISHPTGIAFNGSNPTFIGNSVKMNPEGTLWKTTIYCVDWNKLLQTRTLDASLINTIDDDACIQGARPEYVKYEGKWYVATADYGNHGNEVRLYDPGKLKNCKKTSEPGVLYKKFTCTPWVQNLYWMADKNILVLIQNQIEGRKWRFTYLDFNKSVETGQQQVLKVVDIDQRQDELEGYAFIGNSQKGIAVTSSRKNNVNYMDIAW